MQQNEIQSFAKRLAKENLALERVQLETLQINVGKFCNQVCLHCHVDAGPNKKRENMNQETAERLVELAAGSSSLKTVDLTGGAPELNPNFRYLVKSFRSLGLEVIDRCNLTVLFEKGQEDTAEFLADNKVKVAASMPCYTVDNVDQQRGDGVFEKSIKGLQLLNEFGYGREGTGLELDLVYNPLGAFLPPDQKTLEQDYRKMLLEKFSIHFSHLFCITNMPIKRFKADLRRQGTELEYMNLLYNSFNSAAVNNVMCKTTVSIGWDGEIYDCDFNQMLGMPAGNRKQDIFNLESLKSFDSGSIVIDDHCYGCTAGNGSSCGGNLT